MVFEMREQNNYYVGLDIGTSFVRCVVGVVDLDTGVLSVVGHGVARNRGMRKGVVVHPEEVAQSISSAVSDAERLSGFRIHNATVTVNGSHIIGIDSKGVVAISSQDKQITEDDRYRVEEAAAVVSMPANREIIQVFARNYRLDGQDNIKNPVGMHGVRLEVDTHIVSASTPAMRNLEQALELASVRPWHKTVGGLAAAEATLDTNQKESGTVAVDIGYGTINMAIVEEGEVIHVGVIPMGGMNITNDLAIGLKVDLDVAEAVKLRAGDFSGRSNKTSIKITHGGVDHEFDPMEVHMIIRARIEEMLEYIDKELKKAQRSRKLPGGVVFTGGTAHLDGLAEFAKEKLQLATRIGTIKNLSGLIDGINTPDFATAIGLMNLDLLLGAGDGAEPEQKFSLAALLNKFRKSSSKNNR